MKHLKLFETINEYNNWLNSDNFITPYTIKNKSNNSIIYQIKLPYDKEILYLESNGTQYIDTNIIYNGSYRFEVKFLCNSLSSPDDANSGTIFGTRTYPEIDSFQLSTYKSGCFGYNGLTSNLGITTNTEYITEFKRDNKLYINNVEKLTLDNKSFNTVEPILLFALYQRSNVTERFLGRIYYFKLYDENDNIILDMIPVRKNGIGYMYDKVSKQLFSNQGTGNFVLGTDK